MPSTLLISQRFTDHRIWADIPARLSGHSRVSFYDLPAAAGSGSAPVLDEIRALVPAGRGRFDVVAGAEDAAQLAVGLAYDGLAGGLVLFQPTMDGIPEELEPLDFSGLEEQLRRYAPLLAAVNEPDPAKWHGVIAEVVGEGIGEHLTPSDAALVQDVLSTHAGELQQELQRMVAAHGRGEEPAVPAEGERWIDRLRQLSVPVVIMSTQRAWRPAEVLAARAPHGEAVLAHGEIGMPWLEDKDATIAVLTGMVERCC